jgi:hypothetical protein
MVWDRETNDMEFFDERPRTPGVGGVDDDWPDEYQVRVGTLGGGDTLVVEDRNALGEVWLWNIEGRYFERAV